MEVIIKKRSLLNRIIRLPKYWKKSYGALGKVPLWDKLVFLARNTLIILR